MGHASYHTVLGFCGWDIPALIILLLVIAVLIVRHVRLKRQEKELQDQLEQIYNKDLDDADAAGM